MTLAIVRVPIRADTPRDPSMDSLARETMQALSSTPIEDFQLVRRELNWQPSVDVLHYEGQGTPK